MRKLNRPLRICILKPNLFTADGALRVVSNIVNEFAGDVSFALVGVYGSPECCFDLPCGVETSSLAKNAKRLRDDFAPSVVNLRRYLSENAIDVVMSAGSSTNLHMLLANAASGRKSVFWEHSNYRAQDGNGLFRKLGSKFSDRVVLLTQEDADFYTRELRVPIDRIDVIPNWIDDRVLSVAGQYDCAARRIVSVGRLVQGKGYDLLLEVADRIHLGDLGWRWDIYGEGPLEHALRREIEQRGLANYVFLKGNDPDLVSKLNGYAFLVSTSRFEGLPMSLLEAQASLLPVVSFDVPTGPSEIIKNGGNGFLVEAFDLDAMAGAITKLCGSSELRVRLSSASRMVAAKYSQERIAKKWEVFFESLK